MESEPKLLCSLRLLLDSPSNRAVTFSARGHAECSWHRGRGSVRDLLQNGSISAANVLGSAAVSGPCFSWWVYLGFAQFDHCRSLKQGIN